jgi:arylsulfatase A-like enzyme
MTRHRFLLHCVLIAVVCVTLRADQTRPNIILVMADDMGWGQTGYYNHPVLKTPNLDAMAANGLRFDRFYAAPACQPARASVLTGRSHERTGARGGLGLRPQEKTVAQALHAVGYVTGHFGKWHLSGLRGPGAPVLASDPLNPGRFGFEEWLSATNFFDLDPLLSSRGEIEEFKGDSSDVVVAEALKFIEKHRGTRPIFALIWYGTPHSPFRALPADKAAFGSLDEASANHHSELVAMDRSIGTLRRRLREWGMADNTLVLFCSDNGGLPEIEPDTVGGLRGHKASVYEGGVRVPAVIEWPAVIKRGRVTNYPADILDIFPTVADIVGLPRGAMLDPIDGESLKPLLMAELGSRGKPIPIRYQRSGALVDNRYKLVASNVAGEEFELYDLETDPKESRDISREQPLVFERLHKQYLAWSAAVDASATGKDYPEGQVIPPDPKVRFWADTPEYQRYLPEWTRRWEYTNVTSRRANAAAAKKKKK